MSDERPARGSTRQLLSWGAGAAVATSLLVVVLWRERGQASARWSALPLGTPREGAALFEAKGCLRCHGSSGKGGAPGPGLGSGSAASIPGQLVTSMWNHAPSMWEQLRDERKDVPKLDDQEMADLLAYLATAARLEADGDMAAGGRLFEAKGCATCHAAVEPLRKRATPIGWVQAMWNHPLPVAGIVPPPFVGREMNDLFAFVRGGRHAGVDELLLNADPDRGWRLFRQKSCAECHSVKDEAGQVGPELGPGRELPATILELSGALWNHSASMSHAMRDRGLVRPILEGREMADLVAFLYSVRGAEPGGSPKLGEVLYDGRGCSRCHGPRAEGTDLGPGLRGRGKRFTSISFATALWRHGPEMYERARELGLEWPELAEGDVGDLIAFLNSSTQARPR